MVHRRAHSRRCVYVCVACSTSVGERASAECHYQTVVHRAPCVLLRWPHGAGVLHAKQSRYHARFHRILSVARTAQPARISRRMMQGRDTTSRESSELQVISLCAACVLSVSCAAALSGFGEVSNPPRCVVDLLQAAIDASNDALPKGSAPVKQVRVLGQNRSVKSLQSLMDSLQQVHLGLFVAFRVVGTHYFLAVCWPYAALPVTLWSGGVTLVLSLMAVVVMLQPKPKEGAAAVAPRVEATKSNGKKAN